MFLVYDRTLFAILNEQYLQFKTNKFTLKESIAAADDDAAAAISN